MLAAKVRVLCVTVDPDGRICPVGGDVVQGDRRELDAWNTILSFGNLEVLEVIGKLDVIGSALKVGEVGRFEKLRRVRFRGYMPSEFVRSVLYKAPGLEELDLGVLDPLEVGYNNYFIFPQRKYKNANLSQERYGNRNISTISPRHLRQSSLG